MLTTISCAAIILPTVDTIPCNMSPQAQVLTQANIILTLKKAIREEPGCQPVISSMGFTVIPRSELLTEPHIRLL